MSILGWGKKPKPQVKTVPVEKDDTKQWLANITEKAVKNGAVPDLRTREEIIRENMTHTNAGKGWIETHQHVYDPKTANQNLRLTPEQEERHAREERETDVRLTKVAKR